MDKEVDERKSGLEEYKTVKEVNLREEFQKEYEGKETRKTVINRRK